jgi:hypothetical protein
VRGGMSRGKEVGGVEPIIKRERNKSNGRQMGWGGLARKRDQ